MSNQPNKIIYSMIGVSKFYDKKPVLQGHLSVLFLRRQDRRAGPERLGQELAAADPGRRGQGFQRRDGSVARATRSAFWSRSRSWTMSKTVREVVEEGVQETVDLLEEFNAINEQFAEPMTDDEMNKLIERQGEVQEKTRRTGCLGPGLPGWKWPWTPCAARRATRRSRCSPAASAAAWPCAACCCRSRTSCCWTSRPTIWMPNPWPGWSSTCSTTTGTVIAVTHDRYFLDNVAGWILELDRGHGIPWKGNYSSWLEQKQERLAHEEKGRKRAAEDPGARAGMDPHEPQGPARQGQGPHQRLREAAGAGRRKSWRAELEIYIPPGPRLGQRGHRGRNCQQGLRRQAAGGRSDLQPAARRHRRHHRPQRRRQDHPVPHDHRPGKARLRVHCASATRSSWPTSTRAATSSTRKRPSGR